MRDEEIKRRIASFPMWHYRFDLRGNKTPIRDETWANRHWQRKKYFVDPLVQLFGGSLRGKRVLDLGCNAGFWSLWAARSGCDYVLGIDGRQMHVDQSNFVFEVEGIEKDRYDFSLGNIFEIDFRELGRFDVVLCLGLLYHVSKPVDLLEKISEINDDVLLIDTSLSILSGPAFQMLHEPLEDPRSAVDYGMVMRPTWEAVRDLAQQFGYGVAALKPLFDDYTGAEDYSKGTRRAFLCAKKTDLSRVPAEIEPARPQHRRSPPARGPAGAEEGQQGERREALRHLSKGRRLARAATEALQSPEKDDPGGQNGDPSVARGIEEAIRELEKARDLL